MFDDEELNDEFFERRTKVLASTGLMESYDWYQWEKFGAWSLQW